MPRKKPLNNKLEQFLSDYNQELYDEVSALIPIELQQVKESWSSRIDRNGIAIISYAKTEYPDAAFAHELLLIKCELKGLKAPFVKNDEADISPVLIRFLITHLGHHRIYLEFYDLGFNEEEFLNDCDFKEVMMVLERDVPTIENKCKDTQRLLDGFQILLPYFFTILPNETRDEIKDFKERIIKISKPGFIKEIDDLISEWTTSDRMDYCLTLAKIFKACRFYEISFASMNNKENALSARNI